MFVLFSPLIALQIYIVDKRPHVSVLWSTDVDGTSAPGFRQISIVFALVISWQSIADVTI